jgi:hypothetical protein
MPRPRIDVAPTIWSTALTTACEGELGVNERLWDGSANGHSALEVFGQGDTTAIVVLVAVDGYPIVSTLWLSADHTLR